MLDDIREPVGSSRFPSPKAAGLMDRGLRALETLDVQIGRRIRLRRRLLSLNQTELADRIGVTFQQVHKYETGQSAVTAARLYAIAAVLESDIGYFYQDLRL